MRALKEGYRRAEQITKKYAKTFYFASHFLPQKERRAAYAVYAFCRITDDAVDNQLHTKEKLKALEEQLDAVYGKAALEDSLLLALRDSIKRFHIPKTYFDDLLVGMHMDLDHMRYENFNDLYKYCYHVAGVIGLIMLKILGPKKEAEKYAISLGVAMQLTNILRDIKEDYQRGRIYLPESDLRTYKITEEDLRKGRVSYNFIRLMKFQIERARKYYTEATPGIKLLKAFRSRLVVGCMKEIYAHILRAIENRNYDVFRRRAQVSSNEKKWITLKVLFKADYL